MKAHIVHTAPTADQLSEGLEASSISRRDSTERATPSKRRNLWTRTHRLQESNALLMG
jgi:hypothetical protein